ncbi:hypothetical protein BKA57DRAFT_506689 [Linnemannia elongata]|nr:hypothetical protein BKA57DRAFT_506689 [Linnemannia elongata]
MAWNLTAGWRRWLLTKTSTAAATGGGTPTPSKVLVVPTPFAMAHGTDGLLAQNNVVPALRSSPEHQTSWIQAIDLYVYETASSSIYRVSSSSLLRLSTSSPLYSDTAELQFS